MSKECGEAPRTARLLVRSLVKGAVKQWGSWGPTYAWHMQEQQHRIERERETGRERQRERGRETESARGTESPQNKHIHTNEKNKTKHGN